MAPRDFSRSTTRRLRPVADDVTEVPDGVAAPTCKDGIEGEQVAVDV
jgi:hypothetical protein